MKTIIILEDFDGYPDGVKKRRFTAGETCEIEEAYADLLIAKGHARENTETEAAVDSARGKKGKQS